MILYLHGFRSSPQSAKAQMLAQAVARQQPDAEWVCPQLPASPAQAIELCNNLILTLSNPADELVVIGSSLGGYYAGHLAQAWGCRSVLLNPVIHAARDLATQVGTHQQYHDDAPFVFLPEYIDELGSLEFTRPAPGNDHFLVACTGDEVLNWVEMARWYSGCRSRIINGSDHSISDFARWLPEVMQFIPGAPGTKH
ncbi:MAG: YqiA/YcfP family alpha/beta fold hydrolase [Pusillimonas sp.]